MERTGDGRILVVVDTSFLVNFLVIDRMDVLARLREFSFRAPNHVLEEVTYPKERRRLRAALDEGVLSEFEITDHAEIALYADFKRIFGDGESARLAVSVNRRWAIATDEGRRFQREIIQRLGEDYLLNTPGAILASLRVGILTLAEAEAIRQELAGRRFLMADVRSFEELLREE